ncbi:MAG: hypothetical protein ACK4MU_00245 [Thermomonas sp.]
MPRPLLPLLLTALLPLAGCATTELAMPLGMAASTTRYPVSGLSPRRAGEPIRFGPFSALDMCEGSRFGWELPLPAAGLAHLRQRWAYPQVAPGQRPVESQCQARARMLRHADAHGALQLDLDGAAGRPVLACGFRLDDGRLLTLELQRDGHALQGRLHAPDGDFEIHSLHALRGTPLDEGQRMGLAAAASALLLFDPEFGEG